MLAEDILVVRLGRAVGLNGHRAKCRAVGIQAQAAIAKTFIAT